MKQQWQSLEAEAQQQGWSYGQFLQALCEQELQCRYTRRVERYLKESSLPLTKSLANFDFTYCPTINQTQVDRLVHHATIIQIQQESFRQKQALNRQHSP